MRFVLAPVLFAIAAGCSSSSSTPGTQSPFAGTWTCTLTGDLTFTTPPNAEPEKPVSAESLSINTNASNGITTTVLTDAGGACVLNYSTSGSSATLLSGQSCSGGGLSLVYTSGSATVSGTTLNGTLVYSFNGYIGEDAGSVAVVGTGTTAYTCSAAP